jgi:hypothetical protein
MSALVLFILLSITVAIAEHFQRRAEARLAPEDRLAFGKTKAKIGFLPLGLAIAAAIVLWPAMHFAPSNLAGVIVTAVCVPSIIAAALLSYRNAERTLSPVGLPKTFVTTTKRTAVMSAVLMSGAFCSAVAYSETLSKDLAAQEAESATEQELARATRQRYQLELARIRKEVSDYAGRERHVISEDNILKNAAKTDAKLYPRRLYLKLPLEGVAYHWVFVSKPDLLKGSLTVKLTDKSAAKESVIFKDGALSPDWEMMPCASSPDEMYYGFRSTRTFDVSEMARADLELIATSDLAGIGPDSRGILRKGSYTSFSQCKLYHLEQSTGEKDEYAFLNNDGWNVLWKIDVTSNKGWMDERKGK